MVVCRFSGGFFLLSSVFCVLYSMFCILCFVFCIYFFSYVFLWFVERGVLLCCKGIWLLVL